MKYTTTTLTVAYLTAGLLLQSASAGQTQPADQPAEPTTEAIASDTLEQSTSEDEWRFQFNTWVWALGMEGDVGARGRTVDVSASFLDIVDASDSLFAFSGRMEFGKGRWGGYVDGLYTKIGVDDVSGPLGLGSTDITVEMTVTDFGAMYRAGVWAATGEAADNSHEITLDLYGGGRYSTLDLEVDPSLADARNRSQDWLDPIIGAKLVLPISEGWHIATNADIGGFGVGSDFTWSTTTVAGYEFTVFDRPAMAYFGYRALGTDYSDGDGAAQFTWDVILHGPILGFSLWF